MISASSEAGGAAFVALMKHYVVDYTNSHDQTQTEAVMEPDYVLRMGEHLIRGRDGDYAAATRRQLDQFPGLVLTVHEIVTNGSRLAMRFSEHGASIRHGGARAAWGGVALYTWNGHRLTSNNVEQDYFSRTRQLGEGTPNSVEPPAIAPWDTAAAAPDPNSEEIVRGWIETGAIAATPGIICDDDWCTDESTRIVDQHHVEINDLFSCGPVVAFHISQHGKLLADFAVDNVRPGTEACLHMAGLVHVEGGRVATGRIIRDRLGLSRALRG